MAAKIVIAIVAATLLLPGVALAQTTSTSSSSVGASSSRSIDIDRGDVFSILALGAGGRNDRVDRQHLVALYAEPFLPGDPCVASVRIRGDEIEATRPRTERLQMPLAEALVISNGTLTQEALSRAFQGERERYVLVDCGISQAIAASAALVHPCIERNRGCDLALVMRLVFDPDGIDETERLRAVAAVAR